MWEVRWGWFWNYSVVLESAGDAYDFWRWIRWKKWPLVEENVETFGEFEFAAHGQKWPVPLLSFFSLQSWHNILNGYFLSKLCESLMLNEWVRSLMKPSLVCLCISLLRGAQKETHGKGWELQRSIYSWQSFVTLGKLSELIVLPWMGTFLHRCQLIE